MSKKITIFIKNQMENFIAFLKSSEKQSLE